MNSDVLLIVLTENSWLYAGIVALLPDIVCLQSGFSAGRLPHKVRYASRVVVAVDCRIVFRGEWSTLNALKNSRPDVNVVWLTREETGRVFPLDCCGDRMLKQKQPLTVLRDALRGGLQHAGTFEGGERVRAPALSLTERLLLPAFLTGKNVPQLSRLTGRSVKTLYQHRYQILQKTGFRQPAFLQFVYERNRGLPGIPGLEHTGSMPLTREGEDTGECTVLQPS